MKWLFHGGPGEPTREEVKHFLAFLKEIPPQHKGSTADTTSPEYGTCFSSYYRITDWLRWKFSTDNTPNIGLEWERKEDDLD